MYHNGNKYVQSIQKKWHWQSGLARPGLPKARQKRSGAGRANLGKRAQPPNPPRLMAGWRIGGPAHQKNLKR